MSDCGKDFGLLVVGLLNGDIVVWQLNAVTARRKKDDDLQPQILLQFETKMRRIMALHWIVTDQHTGISNLQQFGLLFLYVSLYYVRGSSG